VFNVKVGVLALQGDVEEHEYAFKAAAKELGLTIEVVKVKRPEQLSDIKAIVIPGGESTTIGSLANGVKLLDVLRERVIDGLPTLGTCAGAYSWLGRLGTQWLARRDSQYSVLWT
jgi:5'-phosphate synthase pdxT subunit